MIAEGRARSLPNPRGRSLEDAVGLAVEKSSSGAPSIQPLVRLMGFVLVRDQCSHSTALVSRAFPLPLQKHNVQQYTNADSNHYCAEDKAGYPHAPIFVRKLFCMGRDGNLPTDGLRTLANLFGDLKRFRDVA
jgi:hypothetical protein